MEEIPADYELQPESTPQAKPASIVTALTSAAMLTALAAGILTLILAAHSGSTANSQAVQIRLLEQSNTRLAGQIAALSSRQAQMSARLAASDPSSDSALITCRDLRGMRLAAVTGGSATVTSVPGTATVSLAQDPVPLPAHCSK